ncbi:MAG: hypothetical protein PHP42_01480 [Bacteroidota bacterium]|nr:hypothetical protein [Bacteroidota bacterium]
MQKRSLNIFVAIVAILLLECGTSGGGNIKEQTLEGTIVVVGNAPFEYLALQTEKGQVYRLEYSKEIEQTLSTHQGRKVLLHIQWVQHDTEGTRARVMSVQLL